MKRTLTVSAGALLLLSTFTLAHAQPKGGPDASPWGFGLGVGARSKIYAGEDSKAKLLPMLSYEGEKFFFRGIEGGYHLLERDGYTLDATLGMRMDGIKKDDFGAAQLAARGINRNLLEDRDNGLELGLAGTFSGAMGEVSLSLKADVSGASKGFETSARYGYPLRWGGTSITPNIGISHYSEKLANYYYGTLDTEVARGVRRYRPGSVVIPSIGVDLVHPFAGSWVLLGKLSYSTLPGKLKDSPLVDRDASGVTSFFVGVSRSF